MMPTELFLYMSIPVMSALVGWGTNVLALKMTFYPLDFVGIPPYLGWQGIIPAKAEKMADKAVDIVTTRLITVEEVFERIDPQQVALEMEPGLDSLVEQIIDETMIEYAPTIWETLPRRIRDGMVARARADAPDAIKKMMEDIRGNISEVFDLKRMVIQALIRDRKLLNEMFMQTGAEEFKFIERSGLIFGFLFGIIQAVIWFFFDGWWILPVAGFLVGYLTNWMALKMIFEPAQPKGVGPFVWQGLFHKRQNEVAERYSKLVTAEIINSRNVIEAILKGPAADKLYRIIQRHVKEAVDNYTGVSKPFIQLTIGTREYINVKERVSSQMMANAEAPLKYVHAYADRAMNIENSLRTKMQALPPEEFESLLRPVFQEDEWKLVAVGGLLGAAVGVFQLLVVFGGG